MKITDRAIEQAVKEGKIIRRISWYKDKIIRLVIGAYVSFEVFNWKEDYWEDFDLEVEDIFANDWIIADIEI